MALPDVVRLPKDHRGWSVLQVGPTEPVSIINVKIDGKNVQLVTQSSDQLRVYVNPSRDGADEWQVPAGIGPRWLVFSPEPEQQAEADPNESSPVRKRTRIS